MEDSQPLDHSAVINNIAQRVPNVRQLYFKAIFGHRHILDEILNVLHRFSSLVTLALPRLWLNGDVVARLLEAASHPMNVIPFPTSYDHVGDVDNVRNFLQQVENSNSPGMNSLTIDAGLTDVAQLIHNPVGQLMSLSVNTFRGEGPVGVRDFLDHCALTLPNLIALHLHLVPGDRAQIPTSAGLTSITADVLEPLHRFRQLRDFRLDTIAPVDISEVQLYNLIRRWPHLQIFSLSPQPIIETIQSQFTLSALIPFMVYCPHLISLSLWINATRLPSVSFHNPLPFSNVPTIRFGPWFKKLDLGSSRISDIDIPIVTNYLAHYFPAPVDVDSFESEWMRVEARIAYANGDPVEIYEPLLVIFDRFDYMLSNEEYCRRTMIWKSIAERLPAVIHQRHAR